MSNNLLEDLMVHQYKYTEFKSYNWDYNIAYWKLNKFRLNDEDVAKFNEFYKIFRKYEPSLNLTARTRSGGISTDKSNLIRNSYSYFKFTTLSGVQIVIIINKYVFIFSFNTFNRVSNGQDHLFNIKAFDLFKNYLREDGIDLNSYKIDPKVGQEIKENYIKKEGKMYKIWMKYQLSENDEGFTNCHHIDFNSSFASGLASVHPEWKPTLEKLYQLKNSCTDTRENVYKDILNMAIGCMHSEKPKYNYQWADTAINAIDDNNIRLCKLAVLLEESGREVLGFNTDGIWYRGEVYHDKGEGKELGQWKHDYTNCKFRSKSDGAYEFIDNKGNYHIVMRGLTTKDSVNSDRSTWSWGDLYYETTNLIYKFDPKKGIVRNEKEL